MSVTCSLVAAILPPAAHFSSASMVSMRVSNGVRFQRPQRWQMTQARLFHGSYENRRPTPSPVPAPSPPRAAEQNAQDVYVVGGGW